MADPTDLVQHEEESDLTANVLEAIIKTSQKIVIGGYAGLDITTGTLEFMKDDANIYPVGRFETHSEKGIATSHEITGDGIKTAITQAGRLLKEKSVVGASGVGDTFSEVYASDGQTLTLTPPSNVYPIGYIKKYRSGIICDVQMYSLEMMLENAI